MALLVLTVFFAGAVLFIKLKLEDLRTLVEQEAHKRTGVDLGIGKVQVSGLKGLIVQDFHITAPLPNGPSVEVNAPVLYVYINLVDLLYGQISIDRVQLDDATIALHRPAGQQWFAKAEPSGPPVEPAPAPPAPAEATANPIPNTSTDEKAEIFPKGAFSNSLSFRVLGHNCMLRLDNVVGDTNLELHQLDFDALRLTDSTDYSVKLSALVDNDAQRKIALNVRFASLEDFDLRLQSGLVTAEDVNVFLPAEQHFVTDGSAQASVRATGYPGGTMVVSLEIPFNGIQLKNQPPLLLPLSGALTALGNYQIDSHVLTLTTAQVKSEQIGGRVEGTISFANEDPEFNLQLHAAQLPVRDALQFALDEAGQALQGLAVELKEPYAINVALQGTPKDPRIIASADIADGTFAYHPKGKNEPDVDLNFGAVSVMWDSSENQKMPKGSLTVRDGTVSYPEFDLKATKIMGTLALTPTGVQLEPFNAEVRGNTIVGSAQYDLNTNKVQFTASGTVAELEKTPLGSKVPKLKLAGSIAVRAKGTLSKEHQNIDVSLDATKTALAFEWWLRKPLGVGLSMNAFNIDITPNKKIKIAGQILLDTVAPIPAEFEILNTKGKWDLNTVFAKTESVDAVTIGKCLNLRYTIPSGHATGMNFEWHKTNKGPESKYYVIKGHIDSFQAIPDEGTEPITIDDADATVTITDGAGDERSGDVLVNCKRGILPPVGHTWFVDLQPKDTYDPTEPEEPERIWTYKFAGDSFAAAPWEATKFKGEGRSGRHNTDIKYFTGQVGEGNFTGSYHIKHADNTGGLKAEWTNVPVKYFLEHINYPQVLSGPVTGNIEYTMDHDDPGGTMKGTGRFAIKDGQFNWEVFQNEFKDGIGSGLPAMPSRKFSEMSADLTLDGDKVTTKNVVLTADGMSIHGDGTYVMEGDIDYLLNVAISPAMADKFPLMKKYFNIEGHRLTQNNIELSFRVTGPAFNPTGSVKGLPPVGVTLVSGAAELTSEALKVVDLPRKILWDLFKIGGAVAVVPK